MDKDKKIGPLDKIHLEYTITPLNGNLAVADPVSAEATVIYGIGSDGITPFEQLLFEKTTGDEISIEINVGHNHDFFGHLQCTLFNNRPLTPPCILQLTIKTVSPADPQEVIKMMAQSAACGSGCDCGCC